MQYGKLFDYPIRIEPKVWLRPDSTCHRTTDAASKSDSNTRRCTRQLLTPYTLHLFFPIACLGFLWEYPNRHHWHWRRRVLEDNEIISVDNICLFKHFQRTNPSKFLLLTFPGFCLFVSRPIYSYPYVSDSGQKKDFLTSEKPGKVACWRYFFKCTSEMGKYLSATFSMHYGNEVMGISI